MKVSFATGISIYLLLLGTLFFKCDIPEDRKFVQVPRKENVDDLKWEAYKISQNFVKKKLKAPSAAKFPSYNPWSGKDSQPVSVLQIDDYCFSVIAYVDAENSFRARIRTNFVCILSLENGLSQWRLESLVFE